MAGEAVHSDSHCGLFPWFVRQSVLPLYFKHSNFSSFARQLNFYGFRKLRSEGILTATSDPTANYVKFYHQNFQRDRPELLSEIRRATKTDQQSKDELDALKQEVKTLKQCLAVTTSDYERRLAELAYDFNRRIGATNAEVEKLAALVRQSLPQQQQPQQQSQQQPRPQPQGDTTGDTVAAPPFANPSASDITAAAVVAVAANTILSSAGEAAPSSQHNLLHSLSQVAAAHALHQQQLQQQQERKAGRVEEDDRKRPAELNGNCAQSKQPRLHESV